MDSGRNSVSVPFLFDGIDGPSILTDVGPLPATDIRLG